MDAAPRALMDVSAGRFRYLQKLFRILGGLFMRSCVSGRSPKRSRNSWGAMSHRGQKVERLADQICGGRQGNAARSAAAAWPGTIGLFVATLLKFDFAPNGVLTNGSDRGCFALYRSPSSAWSVDETPPAICGVTGAGRAKPARGNGPRFGAERTISTT